MADILPTARQAFFDIAGIPLVGGKLYTYDTGTVVPRLTYADAAATIPNTNPIILDARGEATVFWAGAYKVVLKDALDNTIWTIDGVTQYSITGILAAFTANLGLSTGSASIGHIAAGAGAVTTTVRRKLREFVSVLDFIPDNLHAAIRAQTSTVDVRAYIQAAIDSLAGYGGKLYFPRGKYSMGSVLDAITGRHRCLLAVAPIIFDGDGYFSNLHILGTADASTDCIVIRPAAGVDCSQSSIRHMFIGDVATGTRQGNYGIYVDTNIAGSNLPSFVLEKVFIANGTEAAFAHLNNPVNNVNGGVYALTIQNCQLRGGIRLDSTGDSLNILRNTISGTGIGIYVSTVVGASQVDITGNNITSLGGAITLDNARRCWIQKNNIEQVASGSVSSSMINVNGASGSVTQFEISHNNIFAYTGSGIVYAVRVNNCTGGRILHNAFLPSSSTQWAISLYVSAVHVYVGPNQYGTGSLNRVQDGGTGTMGVARALPLAAGFSAFSAAFGDPTYVKGEDGYVTIAGLVKYSSSLAPSTVITSTVLPVDYRPAKSEYFNVFSQNTGPAQVFGSILASAGGNLVVAYGHEAAFALSCRFLAAPNGVNVATIGFGPGNVSDL